MPQSATDMLREVSASTARFQRAAIVATSAHALAGAVVDFNVSINGNPAAYSATRAEALAVFSPAIHRCAAISQTPVFRNLSVVAVHCLALLRQRASGARELPVHTAKLSMKCTLDMLSVVRDELEEWPLPEVDLEPDRCVAALDDVALLGGELSKAMLTFLCPRWAWAAAAAHQRAHDSATSRIVVAFAVRQAELRQHHEAVAAVLDAFELVPKAMANPGFDAPGLLEVITIARGGRGGDVCSYQPAAARFARCSVDLQAR
jgi:hypothetical protein